MQKKKLFFAGAMVCLVILITGFYWYQKPRTSLINIKPAYSLSAEDLYTAFQRDEEKATSQFVEKIIMVTGTADKVQVTDSTISLLLASGNEMGGINCIVSKSETGQPSLPAKGEVVKVKGRCVGFLMDVNLVDAVIER